MALGLCGLVAAEPESTTTERGPHHRVIEKVTREVQPDGSVLEQKSRQIDLATGLHYREGEAWLETRELIEPHPDGAVAHFGQAKAAFSANLNTRGALQVVDAEGKQFSSHLLGIVLTDAASGQSLVIAGLNDSIGQIVGDNSIVYADAFWGDVRADVRYTYRRDGVEQDIVIREPLLHLPQEYGLNPASTRIEIITEFIAAPGATLHERPIRIEADPVKRQQMVLPDFLDNEIHFGALRIGEGRAVDFEGVVVGDIPVGKVYMQNQEGRTFLVEAVEFSAVAPALNALPRRQARVNGAPPAAKVAPPVNGLVVRPFPAAPKERAALDRKPMKQMASLNLRPGFLIDFALTISGGLTNWTFRPEVTHSILGSSTVNLYGTNTIVGGTIIKSASGSVLAFQGTIVCDTTPYHPAVFTASTDNTMGDSVAGGSPSGYYAVAAMRAASNVVGELHDLRFLHAATAIDWTGSSDRFYNLQFINCSNAMRRVNATNAPVHNILATNVSDLFVSSNSSLDVQHLTANNVSALWNFSGSLASLSLTNCVLINVGVNGFGGTLQGNYIATNGTAIGGTGGISGVSHAFSAAFPVFETSVGGDHYLASGSGLRNVGTAATIAANLLSEIHRLTTYAPTLLTSTAHVNVTFSPIASRDNDTPDLGYHYAPLDYIVRGYRLNTNVVLTMTNGVAVGIDYNGQSWGFIFDSATNISIGSPTNMNRIVRAHNVQERSTGNPGTRAMFYDIGDSGSHGDSTARFRFTEFAAMVADGYAVYTGKFWKNWEWSHCWIHNLSITLTMNNGGQKGGITNSIFEWSDCALQRNGTSSAFDLRNNLFRNHNLNIADLNSSSTIRDNLFDNQIIYTNGTTIKHSCNAFHLTTNNSSYATNALPGLNSNIPLTSLPYETDPFGTYGPRGRYYQPTSSLLINAGSQNANVPGLYHFTATTNQVKETNSVVDIGPHYVALNSSGNPVDTDGDGLPDFYEDWNGDGVVSSWETDWQNASDLGLRVVITRPRANSTIP